jgi:hypothetical protein
MGAWDRRFGAMLVVLLLAGCGAGKQFAMPADGSLKLGETTPADAVAIIGEPVSKSSETVTSVESTAGVVSIFSAIRQLGTYEIYNYGFVDMTGPSISQILPPGPQRTLRLVFWNGKLVGYTSMSNFKEDSTDFDDTRIAQIQRGKSTEGEARALFGKPAGVVIFPLIALPDGHALVYRYSQDDYDKKERQSKFLSIYVDHTGVVRDMNSNDTVTPIQRPANTAVPMFFPVITPKGK